MNGVAYIKGGFNWNSKSASKQALAVLIKKHFAMLINEIHFYTFGRGLYQRGLGL